MVVPKCENEKRKDTKIEKKQMTNKIRDTKGYNVTRQIVHSAEIDLENGTRICRLTDH